MIFVINIIWIKIYVYENISYILGCLCGEIYLWYGFWEFWESNFLYVNKSCFF